MNTIEIIQMLIESNSLLKVIPIAVASIASIIAILFFKKKRKKKQR